MGGASGCKSLQLPVFPAELGLPDYWEHPLRPAVGRDPGRRPADLLHIGLNTRLDDVVRRDPTPQKGIFVPMVPLSAAEALGMWVMGGVFDASRTSRSCSSSRASGGCRGGSTPSTT